MTTIEEIEQERNVRRAQERLPLFARYRDLIQEEDKARELLEVAGQLGFDSTTVKRHRRALALHTEQTARAATMEPQAAEFHRIDTELAERKAKFNREHGEARIAMDKLSERRHELLGVTGALKSTQKLLADLSTAFPSVLDDEPNDDPPAASLAADINLRLRSHGLLATDD